MTRESLLQSMAAEVEYLRDLIQEEARTASTGTERLLDAYNETRLKLARSMRDLYLMDMGGRSVLTSTKERIEKALTAKFGSLVPAELLIVKGFHHPHEELLELLVQRAGTPVASSRLRAVTADQVHTERRVRDLRDLGYEISWRKVSGEDSYLLASAEPDVERAAIAFFRKNVESARSLSATEKARLLKLVPVEPPST